MDPRTPAEHRWWRDLRLVSGVFEGGGAKGAAYGPALEAVREAGCWFEAVAGASAGAITATLIAAGLEPEEIRQETAGAFRALDLGTSRMPRGLQWLRYLPGLVRLRRRTGFFDERPLLAWLEGVLVRQVRPGEEAGEEEEREEETEAAEAAAVPISPPPGFRWLRSIPVLGRRFRRRPAKPAPVTFDELYRATKIELNVVAADISSQRLVVFSHLETPGCQVAEAVLASSAIPGALASRRLALPGRDGGGLHLHTLVDGGVWANFPSFVFRDPSFRAFYRRRPLEDSQLVIGFLLDEEGPPEALPRCGEIRFHPDTSNLPLAELEAPAEASPPAARGSRLLRAWHWVLRLPITLSLWILRKQSSKLGPLQWRGAGGAVRAADAMLVNAATPITGIIVWAALVCGLGLVAAAVGRSMWGFFEEARETFPGFSQMLELGLSDSFKSFSIVWVLALMILLIYSLIVYWALAITIGFLANLFALPAARRLGHGLSRTFIAGPGAPPWAGRAETDHVVRLAIPPRVTTLSFDLEPEEIDALFADTAREAGDQLRKILALADRVSRRFCFPAERVFDAWLDPGKARRFLYATAEGEMVRVEIDARVGGGYTIVERRDGQDVEHTGEYLEIDRPRRLVFTLHVPLYSEEADRVVVEIEPTDGGCELTLVHETSPEWAGASGDGWEMILDSLAEALS